MKVKFLIAALFFSLVAAAQPSNYIKFNTRGRWIAGMFDSTLHVPRFNGSPSLRTGGSSMDGAIAIDTTNGIFYFYQGGSWKRANLDTSAYAVTSVYRKTASDSVFYVKGGVHTFAFKDSTGAGSSYTFNSGLTEAAGIVRPGGNLLQDIEFNGQGLWNMQFTRLTNIGFNAISDFSASYFNMYPDTIVFRPPYGRIKMDTLATASSMTNKVVVVLDTVTQMMERIAKDSIGGAGSGTVTSVATNTGTGITGGTITTTGTIAADTTLLATRAILKHRIDSLAGTISGGTPAGINTEIQYNNSGSFGATTGFNFDGTSILSIPATGKYRIGTTQTLYFPNQTDFTGTLIVGNAGGSLSHVTGTDGQYNFFGGIDAGRVNSTGTQNVFVGSQAGYYNTSGYQSTAVGMNALLNQTTARYNTAIGFRAMYGTTDGYFNTAVGSSSLPALTSGYFNSAFGVDALHEVITGVENTATGTDALYNVLGSYNTGYGKGAGRNLKSGNGNISIGYKSMAVPYNSSNTLNIGNYIFGAGIDGVDSTLSAGRIGLGILPASITAYLHLPASTTSYASLRLPNGTAPSSPNDGDVWVTTSGIFARINGVSKQLNDQASGSYINNSASLQSSATFNIDGNGIVGGYLTGQGYTLKGSTTNGNVGIVNSTTAIAGVNNTIFGKGAGASMNGSSANNMLLGLSAGTAITSGANITAIGANSSLSVNTGDRIVTIGSLSGDGITTSTDVVAIGHNAMGSGSSAGGVSYSTAIGSSSGLALTGTITTNIGAYSGYQQTTSDYSTNIGGFTGGGVTTGDWNVNIGAYSTSPSATANGQLNISNIIFGINGYQTNSLSSTPTATGSIGIGVNAPTARLHLPASTSTANTGQLKLTNGTPPTTPETGLINFQNGLLLLDSSTSVRDTIATREWAQSQFYSGTQTPTATNSTNVSASTPGQEQYMRVGNTVTVSGYIEIDCTSASVTSEIDLSLPVPSAFSSTTQLSGVFMEAVSGVASPGHGTISSNSTNDRVTITFTPRADTNLSYRYTYTYQVL